MLDTKQFAHVKKERMKIDASSGELVPSDYQRADKDRTSG
jgi:hypothetical protein